MTYTGQRLDSESHLFFFKNRYYSPTLGRFLARDPLGYLEGMGLFEYARSRPVRFVDPLGTDIFIGRKESEESKEMIKILELIAKAACMRVKRLKVKDDETSVAIRFEVDPDAERKFREKMREEGRCCDCSMTLKRILENINGLKLNAIAYKDSLPHSNIAMGDIGISIGRPGEAAGFDPSSPRMLTTHEMAHFMPKAKKADEHLSDTAVIALMNRVQNELCMEWERTLQHAEEVFINRTTKKKKTIDAEGRISDADATEEEIKALTPSAEVKEEIKYE